MTLPPAVQIEKRRPLTRAEFGQLMIDQEGRCACGCGEKLKPLEEGVIDEHLRALALLGTNALENRALYRKPCAQKKTDEQDTPRIAKAKAQAGETGQYARRKKRGHGSIKSASFQPRNRKLNGSVGPTQAAARAAHRPQESH